MRLPSGILQPPTRPEPVDTDAGQGGAAEETIGPDATAAAKAPKGRKRKATAAAAEKVEDMKLYLTEDVRFRLRMLAFKRGAKISTVANEVLDKALPRWTLERTE